MCSHELYIKSSVYMFEQGKSFQSFLQTMNHHIQYFPSNVLNKIFSFVSDEDRCNSVPFVCEKWKLASSYPLILNNATFEGQKTTNADDICYVLTNCPVVKCVKLVSVNDVVPVLRHMCRCNKHLEKLVMKNCSSGNIIPEEVLINVLLSFPSLKSIELYNTKFNSRLFFHIVAEQSRITGIDISLNEHVTVNDLMVLVHNSRIEEFKMSRRLKAPEISDEEMAHLLKAMQPSLTLLHLDLSDLANLTYQRIVCCSLLTNLKMNNAVNLTAELLTLLPGSLTNLQSLKIEGPSLIAPGDLYAALFSSQTFCSQLNCLKLEYFFSLENEECFKILESCCCLNELSLEGCKSLAIDDVYGVLRKLDKLTNLNLAFIGKTFGLNKIMELSQLSRLVVDELSYEVNDLSKLNVFSINIKTLNRKCKKM